LIETEFQTRKTRNQRSFTQVGTGRFESASGGLRVVTTSQTLLSVNEDGPFTLLNPPEPCRLKTCDTAGSKACATLIRLNSGVSGGQQLAWIWGEGVLMRVQAGHEYALTIKAKHRD
jgi:hypothetical protein